MWKWRGEQGLLSRHTNPYKIPYFLLLAIFTFLKSIAETLPFYQCQPALFISGWHFVIADWFKVAVVTWPPTAKSLLFIPFEVSETKFIYETAAKTTFSIWNF